MDDLTFTLTRMILVRCSTSLTATSLTKQNPQNHICTRITGKRRLEKRYLDASLCNRGRLAAFLTQLFRFCHSIDCNGKAYNAVLPLALIMILVYPIGIPLMYFLMLRRHKDILSNQRKVNDEEKAGFPKIGHLLFLIRFSNFKNRASLS